VTGYSVLGRSFAYLGVPQAKLFVGEIALAAFLVTRRDALELALIRRPRERVAQALQVAQWLFLFYGLFSLARGIWLDRPTLVAVQNLAFNYYSLYIAMGLWAARQRPDVLRRTLVTAAWIHGIYGMAYVGFLGRGDLGNDAPPTDGVPSLFGQPNASGLCVLAMLVFEPRLKRSIAPILMNLATMLAVGVRAEWGGFVLAVAILGLFGRYGKRLAMFACVGALLIGFALVIDLRLPGLSGRGGEVSVQGVIGRGLSAISPELASDYVKNADSIGGTKEWRKRLWTRLVRSVHEGDDITFVFGHGYGYPIYKLISDAGGEIRTPHNVAMYALGYGGYAGLSVFVAFQLALVAALWRAYRLTGTPVGLSIWALFMVTALLGNVLESPFGAIPFYLLMGMLLLPVYVPPTAPSGAPPQR
jgi:hypothetical protein